VCAYIASTDMRGAAAGGLLAAAGDAAPAAAAAQQQLRPGLADIGDIHSGVYFLILVYVSHTARCVFVLLLILSQVNHSLRAVTPLQ
jgi:hypothetical protein